MKIKKYCQSTVATLSVCAALLCGGCSDYLNIVPDNTATIEKMFENKTKIIQSLATCYSYLPDNFNDHYRTYLSLGNEYMFPAIFGNRTDVFISNRVMAGDQNVENPYFSYWNGGGYVRSLYAGIRYCNIFLNNIQKVPDLEPGDLEDYTGQVMFLKAYMHFLLINSYGPIIIADRETDLNASDNEIQQYREPVDVCFKYVTDLMKDAIELLPMGRIKTQLGQVDKLVAASMRAKVFLYWASPLFNGNSEFYGNFKDPRTGETFFNLTYDNERWLTAANALKEAIDLAHSRHLELYTYKKPVYDFDSDNIKVSGVLKYVYNNRFSIVDPWNSELIWGYSNSDPGISTSMQSACQVFNVELPNNWRLSYNYTSASQFATELFHTRNGVPMSDDVTFDYNNRRSLVNLPTDNYHQGVFIPDGQETTIAEYTNREPRFYAWIATDRSAWRTYGQIYNMRMRFNETPGGANAALNGEYYQTGIAIKKLVHPETQNQYWQRVVNYPLPLLRLADIYLMYAEAMNEYYGPSDDVYQYLNLVRNRSGLPDVEEVWSDATIVKSTGKHLSKEGLRDIIRRERLIELSFEGHQYNDVRRWKECYKYYNEPITGWNVTKETAREFYTEFTWQNRQWTTPKDYFTPISNSSMNKNPKLVQNPGW